MCFSRMNTLSVWLSDLDRWNRYVEDSVIYGRVFCMCARKLLNRLLTVSDFREKYSTLGGITAHCDCLWSWCLTDWLSDETQYNFIYLYHSLNRPTSGVLQNLFTYLLTYISDNLLIKLGPRWLCSSKRAAANWCLCHCWLARDIMFSTCLFVRPSVYLSVTKLVTTIFWKRMNWFWCELAQVVFRTMAWHGRLWVREGWSSRS